MTWSMTFAFDIFFQYNKRQVAVKSFQKNKIKKKSP